MQDATLHAADASGGFDAIPLEFFQDYPAPGVNFIDVGCIFDNPEHWRIAIDTLA